MGEKIRRHAPCPRPVWLCSALTRPGSPERRGTLGTARPPARTQKVAHLCSLAHAASRQALVASRPSVWWQADPREALRGKPARDVRDAA